jgi:hypothetical protein
VPCWLLGKLKARDDGEERTGIVTAHPMVVRAGLPVPAKQTQIMRSAPEESAVKRAACLLRFAALTNLGCTPCIHALSFTTPPFTASLVSDHHP